MRNSLFCADGSEPDHDGYTVVPAPPVYQPSSYNAIPAKYEYCDEDQCATAAKNYKQICPNNSVCFNKCYGYQCICNIGYYKYNKQCLPTSSYSASTYPTQKPSYTTKAPYPANPTTYAPTEYPANPTYPANNYPKPDNYLYKPPVYTTTDYNLCPWWKNHYGDCGTNYPDRCSLKYFRFCGEYFFNKVYSDVCKWNAAKVMIKKFTMMLVPLGYHFETAFGVSCVGYGSYENNYLYGDGSYPAYDREMPKCNPDAGAPPCRFLDFTGIVTAYQFHIRMTELYHYWLKDHCNAEWKAQFERMLELLRNNMFCADGTYPDHDGYTIVPAYTPPEYQPSLYPVVPSNYKYCDENQCTTSSAAAYKPACPAHSVCFNQCSGFQCVCNVGYYKHKNNCYPRTSYVYGKEPEATYPTAYPANPQPYPTQPATYPTKSPTYPTQQNYYKAPPLYQSTNTCPWAKKG